MYKRYKNYITSSDDFIENNNNDNNQKNNSAIKEPIEEKEKNLEKNEVNKARKKEKEEKINIRKVTICELCDKRLESKQDYSLHMSSKNHKHNMREFLRKELKECGSVRKVLIKEKLIAPNKRWKINNIRYLLYGFALTRYLKR